ncbi:hypothetical protein A4A49_22462, partial [Nicotiana attenuata]
QSTHLNRYHLPAHSIQTVRSPKPRYKITHHLFINLHPIINLFRLRRQFFLFSPDLFLIISLLLIPDSDLCRSFADLQFEYGYELHHVSAFRSLGRRFCYEPFDFEK